jgi:hypothetical protein
MAKIEARPGDNQQVVRLFGRALHWKIFDYSGQKPATLDVIR